MLEELFDRTVADGKYAISIHVLTSQIHAAKNLDKHFISKSEDGELKSKPLESSEIFADDWEDSLANTPQKQVLPKPEYDDTSHEENNTTANKKSATPLNESSPATPHERSAVNQSRGCYLLDLLLLISNNILSSQKVL